MEEKRDFIRRRPQEILISKGLFLFLSLWPIILFGETEANVKTNVRVETRQEQIQITAAEGSSSKVSITTKGESDIHRPFPSGGQPLFPVLPTVYTGPWKDDWNIINPTLHTYFEGFWSKKVAKQATAGGIIKETLYCSIPSKRLSRLKRPDGVNVSFNPQAIPKEAVPIGVVVVMGGKGTTLWHLIGKAVLEVNKRRASWLLVERLGTTYLLKSSSKGLGMAITGATINTAGGIGGITRGNSSSIAYTQSEPFLQGVAYAIEPKEKERR